MEARKMPQFASVEQPFGCKPPIVHCPICGKASIEIKDDVDEVTPCDHLVFIYIGEVSEFEYQSEDFEKRFNAIKRVKISLNNFKDALIEAGYDNKMLAIEITYGGMACGPSWYTDIFGFDYSTMRDK